MVFGNLASFSLELNGSNLEKVQSYKYLGNMINMINSTRLSSGDIFKWNSGYLCNKARQSVICYDE